ncbi:putative transmembrane region and signal peptide protein [Rhodopirellula islandica]|uniref:Transmembrane region and signal peptide protein n=1 Tax=Rhodopirellula islandica TaxID=595434 RepID=A0A0J1BG38_RHOIS|nr:hypothetical protein [Rhodopirellula islandica]KLU05491.1 putative transmembrane region and signal peptide protein [Rhodopirellula islandica]
MRRTLCCLLGCWLLGCCSFATAEDFFLTIGGGYSPSGNQASLENNVLFSQRALSEQGVLGEHNDIYFSDGDAVGKDLQVMDPNSVPKANRLMAEFFGNRDSLGLSYRNHSVPNVKGSTEPKNIRNWFRDVGETMQSGDRLYVYVTAHGSRSSDRQSPYDTTIATWNNSSIRMKEFVEMLDGLPKGVDVVAIMVQCHAGGFARFIFDEGDPDQGLSQQNRIGFFATVHDRPASGCTPEVDEASYVEYSTYFWAALSGRNRSGRLIERPDYNGDGVVSFDEAHAYTVITADTIDLPVMSSGEFLSIHSHFDEDNPDLLRNDESYALILDLATPSQRAMLEGLSDQLNLSGDERINEAWKTTQSDRDRNSNRRRRRSSPEDGLRRQITRDLERKWPELANVLNPVAIELLTSRQDEFVEVVENHPDYPRFRELTDARESDEAKTKVKYERFVRIADNVALGENLRRLGDERLVAQYEAIVAGEAGTLKSSN